MVIAKRLHCGVNGRIIHLGVAGLVLTLHAVKQFFPDRLKLAAEKCRVDHILVRIKIVSTGEDGGTLLYNGLTFWFWHEPDVLLYKPLKSRAYNALFGPILRH
jgi:hypothetical protein